MQETPAQVSHTLGRYRQLLQRDINSADLWKELKLQPQLVVTCGPLA